MFDLVEMYKRNKRGVVRYQKNRKNTRSVENQLLEVPKFRLEIKKTLLVSGPLKSGTKSQNRSTSDSVPPPLDFRDTHFFGRQDKFYV